MFIHEIHSGYSLPFILNNTNNWNQLWYSYFALYCSIADTCSCSAKRLWLWSVRPRPLYAMTNSVASIQQHLSLCCLDGVIQEAIRFIISCCRCFFSSFVCVPLLHNCAIYCPVLDLAVILNVSLCSAVFFRDCSRTSSSPKQLWLKARCSTSKWKETTTDTSQRWPLENQRRVSLLSNRNSQPLFIALKVNGLHCRPMCSSLSFKAHVCIRTTCIMQHVVTAVLSGVK